MQDRKTRRFGLTGTEINNIPHIIHILYRIECPHGHGKVCATMHAIKIAAHGTLAMLRMVQFTPKS